MAFMWVVPGAPLENGRGWRVWYSHRGAENFRPGDPKVSFGDVDQPLDTSWELFARLGNADRRMGVLTVELKHPKPGATYSVSVPESNVGQPFRWTTLANTLDEPVTFYLSSCFWRGNDKTGGFAAAAQALAKIHRPAFKLLVGDQVYQDWPLTAFDPGSPLEEYVQRYNEYWGDEPHRAFFQMCPTYFLCDDHEYWNNYPEPQLHLGRSRTRDSRREYGKVSAQTYEDYQRCCNTGSDPWCEFRVGRVGFFLLDSRSQRTRSPKFYKDNGGPDPGDHAPADGPYFISPKQWTDLENWAKSLQGPGVLVLGQPMFQDAGDRNDYSLCDFPADYGRLHALMLETTTKGFAGGQKHDILMLSGDIHTGRYTVRSAVTPTGDSVEIHELIASAASRIKPGSDTPSLFGGNLKQVVYQNRPVNWQPVGDRQDEWMIDDNIGVVTMAEGTAGKVRFELAVWKMRPHDSRSYIGRVIGTRRESGPIRKVISRTIELG